MRLFLSLSAILPAVVLAASIPPSFNVQNSKQQSSSSSSSFASYPDGLPWSSNSSLISSGSAKFYPETYWEKEEGVGHFSEWSKATKKAFLDDVAQGRASEWTIVMGNEGGDLDSMTAALTWAYHLSHVTSHLPNRHKAVALLQTPEDALDLRPENKLALSNSKMSSGHKDLLTIDELPEKPHTLGSKVGGIVIVDHPVPLSVWSGAKVLSLFDHHTDRGAAPGANPRIFETVASCTTIVARTMLDELEALPAPPQGPGEYHMPHELLELILSAIAIDSDGLKKGNDQDAKTAHRLLKRSNWRNESLMDVMSRLDDAMSKAKKDLGHLGVRDLLRRDWKGDVVETYSPSTPAVHLGFASVPMSLDRQIERTIHNKTHAWFAIESAWTAEIGADISVCLNSYKIRVEDGQEIREIVLVVRNDRRINEVQADELFSAVSSAIEASKKLDAIPWHRSHELGHRQMVWRHTVVDGGRKLVRPIVEDAVREWEM
ncbi:hypothetical protein IE53DRAFT_349801 [Violaceomyces palustris]|uniref:Uncharacterized protein n=1 Tax=Violaceomyces palustris TaxID=1673888 RepID=A0ACD0NMK1_9BASI|nr:hypothetical protein IE53DRAFT_349801 [Violaceomyces palustris]